LNFRPSRLRFFIYWRVRLATVFFKPPLRSSLVGQIAHLGRVIVMAENSCLPLTSGCPGGDLQRLFPARERLMLNGVESHLMALNLSRNFRVCGRRLKLC
jgi:hypothetical protein